MTFETILFETRGAVGVITLNRPEVHNALNTRLRDDLEAALAAARRDPTISAIILTGAGERAFSAGLDLKEFSEQVRNMSADEIRRMRRGHRPLLAFPKPAIAAVNGLAIGGGVELALQCDIIVAADTASFACAEIKRGIIPGNGGTQLLPRRIGRSKALEIILTGRTVDAAEAERIGLADHVVRRADVLAKAEEIAGAIAANAPVALMAAKEAVSRGLDMDLGEGLNLEGDLASLVYATDDAKEGPRAFMEKRPPNWTGR
ncbi:enoyl-CoA hydratase-related protein [Aquabacter sp. CN5-332]|uniref:enoyl-CoA hydratase/isomerase family protein n=1 Tax=Aquabacter sp. CN5-332 TaxID=3156608 RepID=UPI0032B5A25E